MLSDEEEAMGFLPEGGVMLDVGALGLYWTEAMIKKADVVYAFEPDFRGFIRLIERFKGERKVAPLCLALGDKVELNKFGVMGDLSGETGMGGSRFLDSVVPLKPSEAGWMLDIPTLTIDSLFIERTVTCIKVDTEGYEHRVLKGAEKTIEKNKPVLILEWHENYHEIKDFLAKHGYSIVYEHDRKLPTFNGILVAKHESFC